MQETTSIIITQLFPENYFILKKLREHEKKETIDEKLTDDIICVYFVQK